MRLLLVGGQVFLRYYHVEQLNLLLREVIARVVVLQAYTKGWLAARRYRREMERRSRGAVVIQSGIEWPTPARTPDFHRAAGHTRPTSQRRIKKKQKKKPTPLLEIKPKKHSDVIFSDCTHDETGARFWMVSEALVSCFFYFFLPMTSTQPPSSIPEAIVQRPSLDKRDEFDNRSLTCGG